MGKGGGQQPQQQVVAQRTSDIPEIYKPYVSDVLQRGQALSKQAYVPYMGQQIAGLTPLQQQGINAVPGAANAYQGSLADAAQSAQLSAQQFPNIDISKYMNPFMQNVVDVQKAQAQRDFDIAQAGRDAAATRSNAFGGGRAFVENSLAQDNLARLKDQIQAQGLSSAWTNAGQLFGQDRASALGASQNFQQLGTNQQGLGLNAANALMGAGGIQQQQQQAELSQAEKNFRAQESSERDRLGWLSGIVQGFNPQATDSTTNQTTYGAAPSFLSQVGGLAAMGLGAYMGRRKDGGLVGYADGGSVKGYEDGGSIFRPRGIVTNEPFNPLMKLRRWNEEMGRKARKATLAGDQMKDWQSPEETNLVAQNVPIDTRKDENGIGVFAAPAPKTTGGIAAGVKAAPATPKTTGGINPDAKAPESAVSEGKKVSLEDYLTKSDKFNLPEDKESNALAMALIRGGAKAMQTPGNVGQWLGAGVESGLAGYEEALKSEREARKAKVDELKAVQEINLAIERGDLDKAKVKAEIAKENMETPAGQLQQKIGMSTVEKNLAGAAEDRSKVKAGLYEAIATKSLAEAKYAGERGGIEAGYKDALLAERADAREQNLLKSYLEHAKDPVTGTVDFEAGMKAFLKAHPSTALAKQIQKDLTAGLPSANMSDPRLKPVVK